jgi:hypothetical protein
MKCSDVCDRRNDAKRLRLISVNQSTEPTEPTNHPTGDFFIVKYRTRHANGTFSSPEYRFRNADGRLLRFEDQDRLLRIMARLWCEVNTNTRKESQGPCHRFADVLNPFSLPFH